jgi:hypothetical protein
LQNYGISYKEGIASAIKESEADSLLIMRFIKIEIDDTYASEKKYTIPLWYHDWYTYYSRSFGDIQTPRYNDQHYFAIIEINMYYRKTQTLIWSARSEILIVDCGCEEIGLYVDEILDKLISDGLINEKMEFNRLLYGPEYCIAASLIESIHLTAISAVSNLRRGGRGLSAAHWVFGRIVIFVVAVLLALSGSWPKIDEAKLSAARRSYFHAVKLNEMGIYGTSVRIMTGSARCSHS